MLLLSQPIISNGTYLLLSFVGFLVYAFLYLSYQGILSGKKNDLHKRPPVTGFDSMRKGNSSFSPLDLPQLESLEVAAEETSFLFDPKATFSSNPPAENTASEEDSPRKDAANSGQTSPNLQEEESGEEDENFDWPDPGMYPNAASSEENDRELIGDLTPEELQLIAQVRVSLDADSDAYPSLNEEYREIEERVSRLMGQAGKSQKEVVTDQLTSREKVIFNVVSRGRNTAVA